MRRKTKNKLLKIVKENYSEIAKDFDITRKKYIWPEMERFTSKVPEESLVLDAGCGNGRLLEAFIGKQIDYQGFDSSEELIKFAKKNYPERHFFVEDLMDLNSLAENKYDYIFLVAVILHIPGKELREKVLKNLAKKLKKEGRLIISVWDFYGQDRFKKLIRESELKRMISFDGREKGDLLFKWTSGDAKSKSLRYYHAFTDKELIKLAKDSDLKIEEFYKSGKNIWLTLSK